MRRISEGPEMVFIVVIPDDSFVKIRQARPLRSMYFIVFTLYLNILGFVLKTFLRWF